MKKLVKIILVIILSIQINLKSEDICSINKTSELDKYDTLTSLTETQTEQKISDSAESLIGSYFFRDKQYTKAKKSLETIIDSSPYSQGEYIRLASETSAINEIEKRIDETSKLFSDDEEVLLIKLQHYINTNKNEEVEKLIKELKEKDPKNGKIAYYSIAYKEKMCKLKEALEESELTLTFNLKPSEKCYILYQKARILSRMKKFNKALNVIESVLSIHNKFEQAIILKANILEIIKRFGKAAKTYGQLMKLTGYNKDILAKRASLLFKQKKYNEAAQELEKIKEDNHEHSYNIALLKWKTNKKKTALEYAKKSLDLNPNFTMSKLLILKIIFSDNKNLKDRDNKILSISNNWLTKNPSENIVIGELTQMCYSPKNPLNTEKAIKLLESIQKKSPKHFNLSVAISDISIHIKSYDKALAHTKKALSLTKHKDLQAKLQFQIGFILSKNKKYSEAINTLEKSINKKHVFPLTHLLMAEVLFKSGQINKAKSFIKKCTTSNGFHPMLIPFMLDTKATILYEEKEYKKSLETLEKAIKMAPSDKRIRRRYQEYKNAIEKI